METANAHSLLGASSMYRWEPCPGSVRLSKDIEGTTSSDAEMGTIAHEWLAKCLLGEATLSNIPQEDGMRDAVTVAYDSIVSQMVSAGVNHKDASKRGMVWIEERVDLSSIYPGCFGTADVIIYDRVRKLLIVIDYKNGKGILVECVDNSQLLYYGLGGWLKLQGLDLKIENVRLQIIQPRCYHPSGDSIRSWDIHVLDLFEFSVRLKRAAKRTEDPNAELKAGEHCRFCNAKATCPALVQLATVEAQEAFGSIDEKLVVPDDPKLMSKALKLIPMLEDWCKAVKKRAFVELQAGRTVDGHKLVAKMPRRNWISNEKTIEFLESSEFSELDNLDEKIFEPKKLRSPNQIETSLGLTSDEKKQLSVYTEKKSSGLTLVANSDRRPAVVAGADVEFDEITKGDE